jgi:hypothetical protein
VHVSKLIGLTLVDVGMYFFTSIGVGTKIDPTLCRADRLVGQVLGAVGALPDIFIELEISYFLLRRLLGVRTEGDKKGAKVSRCLWHSSDSVSYNFSGFARIS